MRLVREVREVRQVRGQVRLHLRGTWHTRAHLDMVNGATTDSEAVNDQQDDGAED